MTRNYQTLMKNAQDTNPNAMNLMNKTKSLPGVWMNLNNSMKISAMRVKVSAAN